MQEAQVQVAETTEVKKEIALVDIKTLSARDFINSGDPDKWDKVLRNYALEGKQIGLWLQENCSQMDPDNSSDMVNGVAFFSMEAVQHLPPDGIQYKLRTVHEGAVMFGYIRLNEPLDLAKGYVWANKTIRQLLETFPNQPGSRQVHHLNVIKSACTPSEYYVGIFYNEQTVLQ